MRALRAATFGMLPNLAIRIEADRADVLDHFDAEYRDAGTPADPAPPALEVAFRPVARPAVRGGHKTVSWRVEVDDPGAATLRASIQLRGAPREFGLSLVQGYFVEPLISVASARAGQVLLPSAAISTPEGVLLLLGRSRSGKSSLAVRALAAGAMVLGDDQAFVDRDGRCTAFPRRMRFYSDLRSTAPGAYARLAPRVRAGLALRGGARRLTRGFVAPPVRVRMDAVGQAPTREPVPIERVVLIERLDSIARIERREISTEETVAFGLHLLDEQREKLVTGVSPWEEVVTRLRADEGAILQEALAPHAVERIAVPRGWSASEALPVLAHLLGIPS